MSLSEEFVLSHIHATHGELHSREGRLILDIRMCQVKQLDYSFSWGACSQQSSHSGLNKPQDIITLDASLNDLTALLSNAIQPFDNLERLDVSLNRIKQVCQLDQFRSLTHVNLSHNKITDISFLRNVNSLIELNLSMNDVDDITTLPSLVSLCVLHLNDNKLRRLDGIQSLPYLKELNIQRNNVSSLIPLSSNRNLVYLNAAHNEITSISSAVNALKPLTGLKSLLLFVSCLPSSNTVTMQYGGLLDNIPARTRMTARCSYCGNPIERDKSYRSELLSLGSLTSVDNVMASKDLPYLRTYREADNMNHLRDTASQTFWNQLTVKRNKMEENVRFLQQRILQQQEEFRDYEAKLQANLDTTVLHLNSLALDDNRTGAYRGSDAYRHDIRYRDHYDPARYAYNTAGWSAPVYYQQGDAGYHYPIQSHTLSSGDPNNKYRRGDYKGVTDTDEVLRLASHELDNEKKHQTA